MRLSLVILLAVTAFGVADSSEVGVNYSSDRDQILPEKINFFENEPELEDLPEIDVPELFDQPQPELLENPEPELMETLEHEETKSVDDGLESSMNLYRRKRRSGCYDELPGKRCRLLSRRGDCNIGDFARMCKRTCNQCGATRSSKKVCSDNHRKCHYWSLKNHCHYKHVAKNCKKSCGRCGRHTCIDDFEWCGKKANAESCKSELMNLSCRRSCKICGRRPTKKCEDKHKNCAYWAKNEQCKERHVRVNCKRSCKSC